MTRDLSTLSNSDYSRCRLIYRKTRMIFDACRNWWVHYSDKLRSKPFQITLVGCPNKT